MSAEKKTTVKKTVKTQSRTKAKAEVKAEAISKTPTPKEEKEKGRLALILVRGLVGIRRDIKATLFSLRLRKKHACVVIEDLPSKRYFALKCKDYITYGEINDETLKLLLEKRGKRNPKDKNHLKKFFLLHPPRGGFERKGIKTPFKNGGALGYRGAKINELIKKML